MRNTAIAATRTVVILFSLLAISSCGSAHVMEACHPAEMYVVDVFYQEMDGDIYRGHGIVVDEGCVMTVDHIAPSGKSVWVTVGYGVSISVDSANRIFLVDSEDLILLYLDTNSFPFYGFPSDRILEQFADGELDAVVTSHGLVRDVMDLMPGDSGSPVISKNGEIIGILSGSLVALDGSRSFWYSRPPKVFNTAP